MVSIKDAIRHPAWMFVIGGIVSITCLIISYLIFSEQIGWFTTFLVTIAMTPFMINLLRYEEDVQERLPKNIEIDELSFMQRYKSILKVFTAFFLGMMLSYSVLYVILPGQIAEKLFYDQMTKINEIRGMATVPDFFFKILSNNISVLFLSFFFSFLFGAGAIFILTWNASVLSTAIGSLAKSIGGLHALPIAVIPFFPHGSLEILAYFIGAIAGGIASAALTRKESKKFWFVIKDSMKLMSFSLILLIAAASIESLLV